MKTSKEKKNGLVFSSQTGEVRNPNLIPHWNFLMLYLAVQKDFNVVEVIYTPAKSFNVSATDTVHASGVSF